MKLSTARIFVRDLSQAEHFYGSVLGLRLQAGGAHSGYCVFLSGSIELVVEPVDDAAPQDEQVLVGRFTGLSFAVASVQDSYNKLRSAGVHFTGAPELQAWGGVLATFLDPAGNGLQLVQAPSAA